MSTKDYSLTGDGDIVYLYEHYGEDIGAIGTDYLGLLDFDEPKGLEDITRFGRLWDELLHRGMNRTSVEKVSFSNALRVVQLNAERWR